MTLSAYITVGICVGAIGFVAAFVHAWLFVDRYDDFFTKIFAGVAVVLTGLLAGAVWPLTVLVLIVASLLSLKDVPR